MENPSGANVFGNGVLDLRGAAAGVGETQSVGRHLWSWKQSIVGGWSHRRSHLYLEEKLLCEMDDAGGVVLSLVRKEHDQLINQAHLPLESGDARWALLRPVRGGGGGSARARSRGRRAGARGSIPSDPHMGYTYRSLLVAGAVN